MRVPSSLYDNTSTMLRCHDIHRLPSGVILWWWAWLYLCFEFQIHRKARTYPLVVTSLSTTESFCHQFSKKRPILRKNGEPLLNLVLEKFCWIFLVCNMGGPICITQVWWHSKNVGYYIVSPHQIIYDQTKGTYHTAHVWL